MLSIEKSFMKRANKFFIFTVGITVAIIFIFYILGLMIDDFSDFSKASINDEHKFKLVGLFTYFFNCRNKVGRNFIKNICASSNFIITI